MKRTTWKFAYTGEQIATGAEQQIFRHKARLAWWRKRKEEIMTEIRTNGVTVAEGNAGRLGTASNNKNSYLQGPSVRVDERLSADLSEAHTRVGVHENTIRDYEGWAQVMRANATQTVKLNHDDWLYFFYEAKSSNTEEND